MLSNFNQHQIKLIKFVASCICLPLAYILFNQAILFIVNHEPSWRTFYEEHQKNIFIVLLPITFAHIILAPWVYFVYGVKYAHLINPHNRPIIKDVFLALNVLTLAFIISEAFFWIFYHEEFALFFGKFKVSTHIWALQVLPLGILIFLQVSAEELFIRGFLQQKISEFTSKKFYYIGIPGLIWAFAHWNSFNTFSMQISFVSLVLVLALILGDIADRTKSLIAPIAMHFAFNFFNICFYGNTTRSTTMQLVTVDMRQYTNIDKSIYYLLMGVVLAVVYLAFRKRFAIENSSKATN